MVLLLLFCISFLSSSCGPPALQPWFNEAIELVDQDYPYGIAFEVVREGTEECFQDYIHVTNESSIPLYFPVETHWASPTDLDELDEPCPEKNLCIKVVSGKAFDWDIINRGETPRDYDWDLVSIGDPDRLQISISGNAVMSRTYVIRSIESRNKYDYGDRRPEDIVPPDPQQFNLSYIYNNDQYAATVTITYSINECYKKDVSFDPFENITLCYGVALTLVCLIIISILVLIVKRVERNAKKMDQ